MSETKRGDYSHIKFESSEIYPTSLMLHRYDPACQRYELRGYKQITMRYFYDEQGVLHWININEPQERAVEAAYYQRLAEQESEDNRQELVEAVLERNEK